VLQKYEKMDQFEPMKFEKAAVEDKPGILRLYRVLSIVEKTFNGQQKLSQSLFNLSPAVTI